MLSNSAWNNKTKKIALSRAVQPQMGDSAATTAIMVLDSERHRSDVATPVVYDITIKFLKVARLFY